MSAKCSQCGTNVGCGCNLRDGKCATCYALSKKNIKNNNNELPTNQHIQEQKGDSNTESGEGSGEQAIMFI